MPNCPEDKIRNPFTLKCVTMSGAIAKKLITQHKNGEIKLLDNDVVKLKNLGLLADNVPVLVKAPVKSPKSSAKKSAMKSPAKKSAVKSPKKSSNKSAMKSPEKPVEVNDNVKQRIHNFVEKWLKSKYERNYVDDNHKAYCKSNDKKMGSLSNPVVNGTINVKFEIPLASGLEPFHPSLLDKMKLDFTTGHPITIEYKINNYLKNSLYKGSIDNMTYFENSIDMEWMRNTHEYIQNLPMRDILTVRGYTFYGDVIANNYLRGQTIRELFTKRDLYESKFFPLFFQAVDYITELVSKNHIDKIVIAKARNNVGPLHADLFKIANTLTINSIKYNLLLNIAKNLDIKKFWEKVTSMYIDDLNRIINKAPALKKPMTVYRGVKDDFYLKGLAGNVYKTNGFVSTSLDPIVGYKFKGSDCCVKRITILPGTHVLPMMSTSQFLNEKEILLGSNSKFYVTKAKNFIPKIESLSICPPSMKTETVVTTDVVVIQ